MIRNQNLKEKYLDGEILFRKYFEMGGARTISKLRKFAVSQGMTSSTGKEPTPMGVWKAMWRWASLKENCDVAYEIYHKWTNSNAAEWNEYMLKTIQTAWQFNTVFKYQRFLKQNGWSE
jgi:hypothetical protein